MFQKILHFFKSIFNIKNTIFKINNEEITKGVKFLLSVYIVTMFFIIGGFISQKGNSVPTPYLKYPQQCLTIIKDKTFSFEALNGYYYQKHIMDNECQILVSKLENLNQQPDIKTLHTTYLNNQKEISKLKNKVEDLERIYPQILFEKTAGVSKENSILISNAEDIKSDHSKLKNNITNLQNHQNTLVTSFKNHTLYKDVLLFISNKDNVLELEKKYRYWYPFYSFMGVGLFLIILIGISYSIRKVLYNKQHLIISQLFYYIHLISWFYFIWYGVIFIIDIMPKFFFQKIIQFFQEYNLMFIFNYFVIFCIILFFAFLIKKIQKNSSKDVSLLDKKTIFTALNNKKCYHCNSTINGKFCSFCGSQTKKECPICNNKILFLSKFCQHCGNKIEESKSNTSP